MYSKCDGIVTPLIRVHYMAKERGLCRCNYGPKSVDFELIKREVFLGGADLIRWKPSKRDWALPGVKDALLLALKKQTAWVLQVQENESSQQPEWTWKRVLTVPASRWECPWLAPWLQPCELRIDLAQEKIFLEIKFPFWSFDLAKEACFMVLLAFGPYYTNRTLAHLKYHSTTYYWHQFMGSC